ncbi:class I SAM-dependent methyltransferase [Paenibacillus polysaccharolyticus]|uniref:class I SAM-dependent methyltransferase n=1 Tax=Paenibacillus polysaccharolyticus TaxID=582692 RepID=UPI0020A00F19|nr:class I SAM-dependent methyltransferase [Paenibacillus polysaccharolyticus]MCP1134201.1 class I SAM-dependent methyltransferase [Paenibacillus polysaccharolyticus]
MKDHINGTRDEKRNKGTDHTCSDNPSPMSWDSADIVRYEQSIALKIPGYAHMHDLMDKLLTATIADNNHIRILVTGAGGGKEITLLGTKHPDWSLTGMDTSKPMLDLAKKRADEARISHRVKLFSETIKQLPEDGLYDGATSMLMLHFIQGLEAKKSFLMHLASRLKPGAPLILASVNADLDSPAYPVMMQAWREHMMQAGVLTEEWERFAASLGQTSDPVSAEILVRLLAECGFSRITRYFAAFWVEGYYAIRD